METLQLIGVIKGHRLCKTRHISTSMLWIQHKWSNTEVAYGKVDGGNNVADLLTKHAPWETISKHVHSMGCGFPRDDDDMGYALASLQVNGCGQICVGSIVLPDNVKRAVASLAETCDLSGKLGVWSRTDLGTRCFKGSTKIGPDWRGVEARLTVEIHSGAVVDAEDAGSISRDREHRKIDRHRAMDTQTFLLYRARCNESDGATHGGGDVPERRLGEERSREHLLELTFAGERHSRKVKGEEDPEVQRTVRTLHDSQFVYNTNKHCIIKNNRNMC